MNIKILSSLILLGIATATAAQTESPTTAQENAQPAKEAPALAAGSVTRGQFTSSVQDREPTDNINSADTNTDTLYFFTELKDLQGQTVKHRWSLNGDQKAEIPFNVGGSRWRVWSTKKMQDSWLGTWQVEIINGSGNVIHTATIEYSAAAPATEAKPEAATAPAETAKPAM